MYCKKCGQQIDDAAKFCDYCGAVVGEAGAVQQQTGSSLCLKCSGSGQVYNKIKLIIAILLLVILIPFEAITLAEMAMMGSQTDFFIGGILLLGLDFAVYKWGFKKQDCPVCHGIGRVKL